jgi:hypothetical protein
MGKKKIVSGIKVRSVEMTDEKRAEMQQVFLDAFLKMHKFSVACRAVKNAAGLPDGTTDELVQALVGQWIEELPEFKVAFDRAKKIVARIGAVKAEEFLNEVGSGKQKTGKDTGVSQANVIGAHMVLEADDKQKWSSKVDVQKTETRTITTIVKHYGASDTKVEIIDSPEVKQLPQRNDGNSDEE